jgi:hypothetical protein
MATSCPAATGTGTGVTMSGEATYAPDGTYTQRSRLAGTVTIVLPASCIGPGLTCAHLPRGFIGEIFQSANCTAAGEGCSCALTFGPAQHTNTGRYAKPKVGLLSELDEGETTPDLTDYCVEGSTMTQSPHPGSGSGVSGSIVLERR